MKNLITAALLIMVSGLPPFSFAQYDGSGTSSITGTVISVDLTAGSITVTDTLTQKEKVYTVSRNEDLENIKTGDKVTVILQDDDPTKAANVIKQ